MKIKRTLNEVFDLMDKAIKSKDSNLEVEIELTDEEFHDIDQERYEYDKETFIKELCEAYNVKNNLDRMLSTKTLKRIVDKVFMHDSGSMVREWHDIVKNTINGELEKFITQAIIDETPWTYEVSFDVIVPCSVVVNAYNEEQAKNYVDNLSDEEIRKAIASYKYNDAKADKVKPIETRDYWAEDIDIDLSNKE